MKRTRHLCVVFIFATAAAFSQGSPASQSGVYVDSSGVLRWEGTNEEVSLFGVNYTTPFAYSYRAHKRLGLSLKKAIDLDVAQLARLDLDAFRVHVWDREISDDQGNLLRNEHLDLFDYLLARLAERGFKTILTPIAWWGNGWPEPDETTKGFSQSFSKLELITNPKAREAQRNYLRQFIEHINPYRKFSYRDDPSIIAIEVINEPRHPDDESATRDYINEMVTVLRRAGLGKPIFYNISENWSNVQANAVSGSDIDGVSFQWYPTGLVHNKMLKGGYLINVDAYPIPSDSVVGFSTKAKMVYEFDAADVGGSYMYPAMARSYREAGMQFAAMFSYDPVQIAWSNTEYPTHFLNLLYTPSKALSLMIAAKAFRQLPRMKSYGNYPANNRFGSFRVSSAEDLSEMNTAREFIYSNDTQSTPQQPDSLEHVAGCGSSFLIQYDGTGAYFFDKLEDGIWRLEIYPDILWLRDPFEVTSLSRQVARLFWQEREMRIALPDLGDGYVLHSLSSRNTRPAGRFDSSFSVKPGIYLVTAKNVTGKRAKRYLMKKETFLEGLYTPPPVPPGTYVVNNTSRYVIESQPATFRFQIASEGKISNANVSVRRLGWRRFASYVLKNVGGFDYSVTDTSKVLQPGKLEYCVSVEVNKKTLTFPTGVEGAPGRWDFSASRVWDMTVVGRGEPFILLDVARDRKDFVFPLYTRSTRYMIDYCNGPNSEETALALNVSFSEKVEDPFGFQLNVSGLVKSIDANLDQYQRLVVRARSGRDSACLIGVILLMTDGSSYGADAEVGSSWEGCEIPLSAFRSESALILPNSYPLFLPKVWNRQGASTVGGLDLRALECIQIVVDPSYAKRNAGRRDIDLEISSVSLTK